MTQNKKNGKKEEGLERQNPRGKKKSGGHWGVMEKRKWRRRLQGVSNNKEMEEQGYENLRQDLYIGSPLPCSENCKQNLEPLFICFWLFL